MLCPKGITMRIAMFTDSYSPQINGLVTSIDAFLKQLRKKGHDVHVFAPRVPGYHDKDRRIHRSASFEFAPYKEYRIAVPAAIKGSFDIVHVHSPFSMGFSGIAYARKNRIPVIGTFHTLFPEYGHYLIKSEKLLRLFRGAYRKISWSYLRWFYSKCDYITVPSGHVKKQMIKHGIKRPVYVIPTGIEVKSLGKGRKSLRRKHGFAGEKIILHVGRLTREKNILFILRSLEKLLRKENAVFVITSDGPYRSELEREAVKLGLQKKVKFTGYVDSERLGELYAIADVFVIASKTETQGIVLIEAVANKLPIVALNAPVTGDFLKENEYGIVANSKNFAGRVSAVLKSGRKAEESVKNAPVVLEKYSAESCADEMLKLYEKAAGKMTSSAVNHSRDSPASVRRPSA
ncbi:MAG: glycosyltransferase [Candidatus Aenigmarchaeota archaeon]|nr:glycosyltransferase [Candidatus Aenigmarchaeota archaeon]